MKESNCPFCNKRLDTATGITTDSEPEPGDITICLGCTQVLIFTEDLGLKEFIGELDSITALVVYKSQEAIRKLKAHEAAKNQEK